MSDKNYDIASFWQPLLSSTARGTSNVQGWEHVTDEFEAFWPAPIVPLEISDLDTARPDNAKIFLISSPGAVGKTTLARQLARVTGAMLVNLAKTLPVGAHTLTGGISKTDLEEKFKQGEISLIVDGLDEGRIHTQSGETFEAFIKDVADLVKDNAECKPIVLLGRSLAVKDTLVALNLEEVSPAVFQIDYYDVENAAKFVELQIAVKNKKEGERVDLASITQPQKEAIGLYLKALQALVSKVRTLQSTQSFAGYSPVLMAVAESVSDAANVQKLVNQLEKGDESASLNSIARSILQREQSKIKDFKLGNSDQAVQKRLYSPAEQLARLATRYAYKGIEKEVSPFVNTLVSELKGEDQAKYEGAIIEKFLPEHPFLNQKSPHLGPSEIFGGYIAVNALRHDAYPDQVREVVRTKEIGRGAAANPFISHFYMEVLDGDSVARALPADHVGLLYISLCAGLPFEHTADIKIQEDRTGSHRVKITVTDKENKTVTERRYLAEGDRFVFDSDRIKNVEIRSNTAEVHVGAGSEVVFTPPVIIETSNGITLDATQLVVDYPLQTSKEELQEYQKTVFLRTDMFVTDHGKTPPTIRGDARLQIVAPDLVWPLDRHFVEPSHPEPNMKEPLTDLKNILSCMVSRSHGGRRAPQEQVLGIGAPEILQHLLDERVFVKDGKYYQLDATVLAERVALNLNQVHGNGHSEQSIRFLKEALGKNS